jgi:hypothetical protein
LDGAPLAGEYLGKLDGNDQPVAMRIDCHTEKRSMFIKPETFNNPELLELEFMEHPVVPWRDING